MFTSDSTQRQSFSSVIGAMTPQINSVLKEPIAADFVSKQLRNRRFCQQAVDKSHKFILLISVIPSISQVLWMTWRIWCRIWSHMGVMKEYQNCLHISEEFTNLVSLLVHVNFNQLLTIMGVLKSFSSDNGLYSVPDLYTKVFLYKCIFTLWNVPGYQPTIQSYKLFL